LISAKRFSKAFKAKVLVLQSTLGNLFGSTFCAHANDTGAMSVRQTMSFDVFMDLTFL